MLKIGLTGGIGSGKTTVCRFFELLGVPVFNSDLRARVVMEQDLGLVGDLIDNFGPEIYNDQLKLNRKLLASKVFNNPQALATLNALVHPVVFRDFDRWRHGQKAPFVIKEAAILFESGSYKDCDAIILVTAPLDLRIKRVGARDGLSEEEIRNRIARQLSDEEKALRSDFIVVNDEQRALIPELLMIYEQILKMPVV